MSEPFYKTSEITGKRYNLFSQVRILNIQQVIFYLKHGVYFSDIEISTDRKRPNTEVMVFLFEREETVDVYRQWLQESDQIYDKIYSRAEGT